MGQASKIWLHHSLKKLNKQMNNNLLISRGNPENILLEICKLEKIKNVFWNRVYEPWAISRDKKIKENFNKENIQFDNKRIKRTKMIDRKSRLNYFVFHLGNPFLNFLRNLLIKYLVKDQRFINSYLGKIYKD